MEVILLKNVAKVGTVGELKKVNDGFARNFLLPQKLAVLATADIIRSVAREKDKKISLQKEKLQKVNVLAEQLMKSKIYFSQKANDEGTLFRGITKSALAKKIFELTGQKINEDSILLEKPIKHLGEHAISLSLDSRKYNISIIVNNDLKKL